MAIELLSKIKPKNGGSFPMVDAEDVLLPDGKRLDAAVEALTPVYLTQSEYDALVAAGEVREGTLYLVTEDGEEP